MKTGCRDNRGGRDQGGCLVLIVAGIITVVLAAVFAAQ